MECATGFVVKPADDTFSMQTQYCKNAQGWQAWLKENHDQKTSIWLVFYKKISGKPTISYADALDEALCFGWIDSLIKKLMKTNMLANSRRADLIANGLTSTRKR